jgi:integrase/recombinase XerD
MRDRLLIGVMKLEGIRSVKMHRLNIGDVLGQGENAELKVSSKRHTRMLLLTP